jgi:sporulation protein YabP
MAEKVFKHSVIIENREKAFITGVADVDSFDEDVITARTENGALILRGVDLHVTKLNLEAGELNVSGQIFSLVYEDAAKLAQGKNSFLGKIFK